MDNPEGQVTYPNMQDGRATYRLWYASLHSNLETTLIYAHADTELKRKALEKAVPVESPLKEHLNAERYKVSDEELLKRLCGLK